MRYRVLGPVAATDGRGVPLPLVGSRQRTLLGVLLANAGQAVSAERLAESLWGGQQPSDPVAALQSQISRLRHRLGPGSGLETAGRGYRLRPADDDLDSVLFERLLARARSVTDARDALRLLDSALTLWRGPAYGELATELDVRVVAERLQQLRCAAREERAAALLVLGRAAEAAAEAASLIREHPLRERAVAIRMQACHEAGSTGEALAAYDTYRIRLAEELGLDPPEQLRRLHMRVLCGDADFFSRGLATVPRPTTSYVGRGDEVSDLVAVVRQTRHVTLTGPGGVGKTRLASEVAARLIEDFPDGVWFCDLAAVTDQAAVAASVASTLAVTRRHGGSVTERLIEVLGGRRALLVLDNCEHVRAAAAFLAQRVVEHTAEVHVVATSREVLGVPGERRVVVEPLTEEGGCRLFADRAVAARPGLLLDPDDLAAARHISREVAGLPLAVELAAARAAARTPVEIAADLAGRVDRLAATRSGPARHRSVAAVVDWSLDRLTDSQRDLAEHLAVFARSCTVEAGAAVVDRDVASVADLFVDLVDRSLVAPRRAGTRTRYTVLEPVRARAEQRLRQRGLLAMARKRHAAYFADLTARAWAGLRTTEAAHWLDVLDAELPNLRAAWRWSLDTDGGETALRLLAPLYEYTWSRMPAEVSEWAEAAAGAPAADGNPALPAVLGVAALGAWRRGDLPHARRLARQATAAPGPPAWLAVAFSAASDVPFLEGRLDDAVSLYGAAVSWAVAGGDPFRELVAAADLAMAHGYAGDAAAAAAADDVCVRAEELGTPLAVAYAEYAAGEVRLERCPEDALTHLRHAEAVARDVGDRFIAGAAGLSATSIVVRRGDATTVLRELAHLLDEWHRAGSWNSTWITLRLCIDVFVRLGEHKAAAQLLAALRASSTASPAYGPDAERLARAETALRSCLGRATYEALAESGATLGDAGAVAIARRALDGRSRPG